MLRFPPLERKWLAVAAALLCGAAVVLAAGWLSPGGNGSRRPPPPAKHTGWADASLDLGEKQVAALTIAPVGERSFAQERQAVGDIDFNRDQLVSVFTPYQGRVIAANFHIGDRVEKDQVLFTIDSPDLLTAESTLIAATGVHFLQSRTLNRAKSLIKIGGISQQAVDQTTSDQQTAEGALKSARDAVRIFGKSDEEIDRIVAERRADPRLVVKSPISGYVTTRAAAPGLLVQPGVAPAPYTIADTSTMWMVAHVVESEAPFFRPGQPVRARVAAYPDRLFEGAVKVVGPAVDPLTRRIAVISEIANVDQLLRAGMFANFTITVGDPVRSPYVRAESLVREGDGAMTAWVTTDRRRFLRRVVQTGRRDGDFVQILSGLAPGELVVGEGAVFLSNEAAIAAGR